MLEISIYYNYTTYNEIFDISVLKSCLNIQIKEYIVFHEYIQSFSKLISYYNKNLRNLKYYVNKN
jgi:hypothetical protein